MSRYIDTDILREIDSGIAGEPFINGTVCTDAPTLEAGRCDIAPHSRVRKLPCGNGAIIES